MGEFSYKIFKAMFTKKASFQILVYFSSSFVEYGLFTLFKDLVTFLMHAHVYVFMYIMYIQNTVEKKEGIYTPELES